VLKVVVLPYLSFAPLFIAQEEGYFAEQGLQIEFVRMERSLAAVSLLDRGKLDVVGGTVSVGLLNAAAHGARIRIVADKGYLGTGGCTASAVVARRALVESGRLDPPAKLRGLRIAFHRAAFSEYCAEKTLQAAGLTLDELKAVDIPEQVVPEALKTGTVDLATLAEPWLTRMAQEDDAVIWSQTHQVVPDFQSGFILYGRNLLDADPEIGRRFMLAYLKGVRQYNQGKTERNLEILARHTGLDRELLRKTCWIPVHETGQINVQSMLNFQSWATKKGLAETLLAPSQFWDPRFVEYANQVLNARTR
jgi:NitT/TauT family transport system substrate-binding protein